MATNIDKALFQQPQGMESLAQDEEAVEIEIIDPEEVNIRTGDLELSIKPGEDDGDDFNANLAEEMDESSENSPTRCANLSLPKSIPKNTEGSRDEEETPLASRAAAPSASYRARDAGSPSTA